MIKGLLWLVGGTIVFCVLVTYPASVLWPDDPILWWNTTAAALCLVPTALTLVWARRAYGQQPEQQMLAVMGGTGVRMAFVLAVGLLLFFNVKEFAYQRFWIFVIVYYLFTLALEMVLIVRNPVVEQAAQKQ